MLGLSVGQKRVLESLVKDGGLEKILKKIEGAGSLEDSLLAIGSRDFLSGKTPAAQNLFTMPRLDNDPHVFLGPKQKAVVTKQGEKPLLIPDLINLGTSDNSAEEQEIGNNTRGTKIVLRAFSFSLK